MKKILLSVSILVFVGAIVAGATGAFFSDTETSTGNTFTAGAIDLKVDYDCYWNITPNVGGPNCPWTDSSWTETDLGPEHKFFSFDDLKPGDFGEGTISLHLTHNDGWARFRITDIIDEDNGCTEPEVSSDTDCPDTNSPGADGELDDEMGMIVWLDQGSISGFQNNNPSGPNTDSTEGDNIWQEGEPTVSINDADPDPAVQLYELWDSLATAYSNNNCTVVDGHTDYGTCHGLASDGRMVGSAVYYYGVAWCFGTITDLTDPSTCDGSSSTNITQTDKLEANFAFEVVQHRNNPSKTF